MNAALGRDIRKLDRLVGQYAESHRHPTNVIIHWICVPIIVWCALALAWTAHPYLAMAMAVASLFYYFALSLPLALAMTAFAALCLAVMPYVPYLPWVAVALFVLTWSVQFVGHQIEGKKPSFLEDLQFLLVGPLFLLTKLFRKLGLPY